MGKTLRGTLIASVPTVEGVVDPLKGFGALA
jgi:hypothetical protein